MRHDSLKTSIRIAQATTRIHRSEATKLRAKAQALYKKAKAETDQTKKTRLDNKGWGCSQQSVALRAEANSERGDRRHMHLAAALLNGRTYKQAEAKCEPHKKPQAKTLVAWIRPHLPAAEQAHAEYIAEVWLKDGTLRLTHIQETGLVQLLSLDKQKATIASTKASIKLAEKALADARQQVTATERNIAHQQALLNSTKATETKAKETLTGLLAQLAQQEADLRRDQEALTIKKAKTNSIDDLFEVA